MARHEITIKKFFGGISDDLLAGNAAQYAHAAHLDDFTQPYRLSPYRSYVADETGFTSGTRVLYGSDGTIYGIGSTISAIYYKADVTTASWTLLANDTAGNGATDDAGFAENRNYLYMWDGAGNIDRVSMIEGTYTSAWQASIAGTANAGPIYSHSNGDIYFAYGNNVASWDGTTFTNPAVDIPLGYQIVDLTEWNGYLVIGARWGLDPAKSRVFFWNPANNNTYDFSKVVPEGVLYIVKNIGDEIAAIAVNGSTAIVKDGKVFAYIYNGAQFELKRKLVVREDTNIFIGELNPRTGDKYSAVKNNQLYFAMRIGSTAPQIGVWRFGKNNGTYCLKLDRFGTTDNSETALVNIAFVGDYLYTIPAVGTVRRTDDTNTYSSTGNYQTLIYGGDSLNQTKNLLGCSLSTRPLASGANCTVSFRNDSDTAWTTLGTHSGTNAVQTELASTAAGMPKDWNTIQFRVETGGNAEEAELTFVYEDQPQAFV